MEDLALFQSQQLEREKLIQELQSSDNVPSMENIEKLLKGLSENVPEELRKSPMIKSVIKLAHQQASMIDVDNKQITELFEKYGFIAPVFEEQGE